MNAADVLETVLARIADSSDGIVYITEAELARWAALPVAALKADGLLIEAPPARSATCDGCERQCSMAVEVIAYPDGKTAFIFCDKRDDVDRVEVPFDRLRRRQASGEAVADFLAGALGIGRSSGVVTQTKRWPVGLLRDKRSAQVELVGEKILTLEMAGHEVPLGDVLTLKGKALSVDRRRLVECVNNPVAGGGTPASAAARAARIAKLARDKGVKAAAAAEGVSEARIKQITAGHRKREAAAEKSPKG